LGNSTCTSYYKCKNCGQIVNKRMGDVRSGKHQFVLSTCLADTFFIDALIHAF
jgi:hypothetical protein